MNRCLRFLLLLAPLLIGLAVQAQPVSPNKVNYQVTFDPNTNRYSVWAIPQYNVPNTNNTGATEIGATAQVTLKVPASFVIDSIQDVKGTWIGVVSVWIRLIITLLSIKKMWRRTMALLRME